MKKTFLTILITVMIATFCFSGCGNQESTVSTPMESAATMDEATMDEATADSATVDPVKLSFKEPEYPAVSLDSNTDWESLYYEYLRMLDTEKYPECALVYVNDDDVPELYVKAADKEQLNNLSFVTKDGLYIEEKRLFTCEEFLYLERANKIYLRDYTNDTEAATKAQHNIMKTGYLGYFYGDNLDYDYRIDLDEDDGSYDFEKSYGNENAISISDYNFEKCYGDENATSISDIDGAIKSYFDVEKAKTPKTMSISDMIAKLKEQRKNPNKIAEEYYVDVDYLVSTYTYRESTENVTFHDGTRVISYKIPQINLEGEYAKAVNKEILDELLEDAEKIDGYSKDDESSGYPSRYKTVDYEAFAQNGILSLVITKKGYGGSSSPNDKSVYSFEIATGEPVNNICLLHTYGIDPIDVYNAFDKQVKADYDAIKNDPEHPINSSGFGVDESTCDDLYKGTMEHFLLVGKYNKMYFDDEGNLNIIYWYKWVAGSEFYEKTMLLSRDKI